MSALKPFVAEHFCAQCKTPFANEFPLDEQGRCALCRLGVTGFDAAYCYGSYDGSLREMVHLFKYGRMKRMARPLGKFLSSALPLELEFDIVVHVPLHWRRHWARGFNQAQLLARQFAARRGVRLSKALARKKWTGSQASLTNAQRRANVAGAFRVRGNVTGLRILLVDDVMTTGATAAACAMALKRAGAKHVTLLTLARVDRRLAAPSARKTPIGAS